MPPVNWRDCQFWYTLHCLCRLVFPSTTVVQGMGITAVLAFALTASPATVPHMAGSHAKQHYVHVHRRSLLMANLGVCTEQDCLQQGAPRTLAKLRKAAKGTGIKVSYVEIAPAYKEWLIFVWVCTSYGILECASHPLRQRCRACLSCDFVFSGGGSC